MTLIFSCPFIQGRDMAEDKKYLFVHDDYSTSLIPVPDKTDHVKMVFPVPGDNFELFNSKGWKFYPPDPPVFVTRNFELIKDDLGLEMYVSSGLLKKETPKDIWIKMCKRTYYSETKKG